jgi:hypothetical protein
MPEQLAVEAAAVRQVCNKPYQYLPQVDLTLDSQIPLEQETKVQMLLPVVHNFMVRQQVPDYPQVVKVVLLLVLLM